jgi:hypothetical protein
LPLRGACSPYLCPTKINVFNKFCVKYFLRVVVEILREEKTPMQDDGESASPNEEEQFEVVEDIESGMHEITLWK